jgi:hypothetical protein
MRATSVWRQYTCWESRYREVSRGFFDIATPLGLSLWEGKVQTTSPFCPRINDSPEAVSSLVSYPLREEKNDDPTAAQTEPGYRALVVPRHLRSLSD